MGEERQPPLPRHPERIVREGAFDSCLARPVLRPHHRRRSGRRAPAAGHVRRRPHAARAEQGPASSPSFRTSSAFRAASAIPPTPRFGQAYLANSFQATFNVDNDLIDGLVIPTANTKAAANILDQYKGLYLHNGKLLDPIPNLGEDNFTAEDHYLGRAIGFRIDRFVIAFNGYKDRQHLADLAITTDQRILGTIRKQLNTADGEEWLVVSG